MFVDLVINLESPKMKENRYLSITQKVYYQSCPTFCYYEILLLFYLCQNLVGFHQKTRKLSTWKGFEDFRQFWGTRFLRTISIWRVIVVALVYIMHAQ